MKHPFENHSEREPRWRRPADDPRGPDTVTFIPSTAGCGFVAVDSKPLPHPHARFNRWLYEPLLILTLPLVTMLSLLLAFLFVTLQSLIGDVSARCDHLRPRPPVRKRVSLPATPAPRAKSLKPACPLGTAPGRERGRGGPWSRYRRSSSRVSRRRPSPSASTSSG